MAARLRIALVASALLVAALLAAAVAQPFGPGAAITGPGMMSGPGMAGSWMFARHGLMCNPAAPDYAERRTERLAELVKPTDAQRGKIEEFKAASIKSAQAMRDACPTEIPQTIVGRAEAMEKRADAMLQAVRMVWPALEAFYATLSDEQKARIDSNDGRGRFRRWRDRW